MHIVDFSCFSSSFFCSVYQSDALLIGKVETMDTSDDHDSAPSVKKSVKTSLLDSGEDFEVLDEEDIDDDLPPLEDAGGGNENKAENTENQKAEEESEASEQMIEWLDVLGM